MTNLTLAQAHDIADRAMEKYGIDADVYAGYAGRFGITVPAAFIVENLAEAGVIGYCAAELDIPAQTLPGRWDNMGKRYILY